MKKIQITKKKAISWGIQLLIFIGIFYGVSKWQSRNLLPEKTSAPDFTLKSLSNKDFSLSDQKGKKIVLYFFSPWCTVCKLSSGNIVELRKDRSKDKVAIFAIGQSYRNVDEVKGFAKKHKLNVPVLLGNRSISSDYKISAFPTIYIIDEHGKVKDRVVGYTTEIGLKLRL